MIVRIILWLRVNIILTKYFHGSISLQTLLKFSLCLMHATWVDSSHHHNVSTMVYLGSSLTQSISPTTQPNRFPFLPRTPTMHLHSTKSRTVQVHLIESSDWQLSQRQQHSQIFWIWYVHFLFNCLPPI